MRLNRDTTLRWLLSAWLGIGAAVMLYLIANMLPRVSGFSLIIFSLMAAMNAWLTWSAVRLALDRPDGYGGCLKALALQVPMIDLPVFQYDWFFGAFAAVGIRFDDGLEFFGRAVLHTHQVLAIGPQDDSEYRLGANVLAIIACVTLAKLRAKHTGTGTSPGPVAPPRPAHA